MKKNLSDIKKGDIILTNFKFDENNTYKLRPSVVIILNSNKDEIQAVYLTSQQKPKLGWNYILKDLNQTNLKIQDKPNVVCANRKCFVTDKKVVYIGCVSERDLLGIEKAIINYSIYEQNKVNNREKSLELPKNNIEKKFSKHH